MVPLICYNPEMKKRIFVTATNTDIGKTYTTNLLLKTFALKGIRVGAIKLMETGVKEFAPDGTLLLATLQECNEEFKDVVVSDIVPITYELPAAPYIASMKTPLDMELLHKAVTKIERRCDLLIIEGAGGLYVPIDSQYMMIDMIEYFKATAVLVTHCALGCINDTLLSEKALQRENIDYITLFNCKDNEESFSEVSEPYFQDTRERIFKVDKDIDTICDVLYNM